MAFVKDAASHDTTQQTLTFAHFYQALAECSNNLRAHAMQMIAAINDKDADDEDRYLAATTLFEILFPYYNEEDNLLGMDLEYANKLVKNHGKPTGSPEAVACDEAAGVLREMESEESTFADRLGSFMTNKGMTQIQLAERLGIGQPAIAMMLKRECRPQKRTVFRLAEALGVSPEELWPK